MTSAGKIIGERVRQARIRAGLTQEKLAQKSQISTVTISRLERGATEYPRRAELEQIARALGLDIEELTEAATSHRAQTEPAEEDGGPSDDEINAAISELLSDTGVMLAFMSDVREPSRLSRTARLDILSRLRTLKARQQRQQG